MNDWPDDPAEDFDRFVPVETPTEVSPRAVRKVLKRRTRWKSRPPKEVPTDPLEKLKAATKAFKDLTPKQRAYLQVFQEAGFSQARTLRTLAGTVHEVERSTVTRWRQNNANFSLALRVVMGEATKDVMNPERLLLRQDDIVETLMTPKPILHKGVATGYMEVDGGAASRANEILLRASGVLKEKDQAAQVFTGPSFHISVVQRDQTILDVVAGGVDASLPPPVMQIEAPVAEEDWLDA